MRWVAFIRGINVSGQKLIKMDALKASLESTSLENIRTYIQSGNIIFNSDQPDPTLTENLISEIIENDFGFKCPVIVRKISEIEQLINQTPYKLLREDSSCKFYITMTRKGPFDLGPMPVFSPHHDVEIVWGNGKDFLTKVYQYKGNYGVPNVLIEKLSGSPATTRNANTLEKIITL